MKQINLIFHLENKPTEYQMLCCMATFIKVSLSSQNKELYLLMNLVKGGSQSSSSQSFIINLLESSSLIHYLSTHCLCKNIIKQISAQFNVPVIFHVVSYTNLYDIVLTIWTHWCCSKCTLTTFLMHRCMSVL
jgi:hypothetical protein